MNATQHINRCRQAYLRWGRLVRKNGEEIARPKPLLGLAESRACEPAISRLSFCDHSMEVVRDNRHSLIVYPIGGAS